MTVAQVAISQTRFKHLTRCAVKNDSRSAEISVGSLEVSTDQRRRQRSQQSGAAHERYISC
jgi:hypothetical protein